MPPITFAAVRKTLSSALYLGLCLATIGHFVLGAPADLRPVGAVLLVYLLLEVWAASRLILGSAAVLVGLGLLAQGGDALGLLVEAGARTLPFLVLFLAVLCLQGPALASPTLRALGGFVAAQPPGRRFAGMALAGHRELFETGMARCHLRHGLGAEDIGVLAANRQHRYGAQAVELRPQERNGGFKVDILDCVDEPGVEIETDFTVFLHEDRFCDGPPILIVKGWEKRRIDAAEGLFSHLPGRN